MYCKIVTKVIQIYYTVWCILAVAEQTLTKGRGELARRIKHDKVIRGYDGIDREESTAGLMFLRIFIVFVLIIFITATAALFAYKLSREASGMTGYNDGFVQSGEFYQKYNADEEKMLLQYCNSSSPMSEYDSAELVNLSNNVRVNVLMEQSLEKMMKAGRADGISFEVEEGYISYEECNDLNKTCRVQLQSQGYTSAAAELKAAQLYPKGSCNEFRTGLLIRIKCESKEDFDLTDTYAWLYKNGVDYGFINRYTDEKFEVTGVEEDLTVYRFVGTENAKKMRSFNMCLEEYSDYMSSR